MRYRIDSMSLRGGELCIDGWAFGSSEIKYELMHRDGSKLRAKAVKRERADVMKRYGAPLMCGFTIKAEFKRSDEAWLCLTDGSSRRRVHISGEILEQRNQAKKTGLSRLSALMTPEKLENALDFLRENGLRTFLIKTKNKLKETDEDYDYTQWEKLTSPDEAELRRQRRVSEELSFEYNDGFYLMEGRSRPLISIVIPAYNTPEKYLRMLFDSILAQTYPYFEVIVADGSEENDTVSSLTGKYASRDGRFRHVGLGKNRGISENTNAGIAEARGDYIALCDHDDELPPYALFEVAKAISENPGGQFFYTDEDKVDLDGGALFDPNFKPDYDPELLLSVNYICHLSVIRRDLLHKVGGFRGEYDGAQDHDFFLRCTEEAAGSELRLLENWRRELLRLSREKGIEDLGALRLCKEELSELSAACGCSQAAAEQLYEGRFTSEKVVHIRKVCYHWRFHKGSTASDPSSKLYAFEAGARAVRDHYQRMAAAGFDGRHEEPSKKGDLIDPVPMVERGVTYGFYKSSFSPRAERDMAEKGLRPEDLGQGSEGFIKGPGPLISILIPTKDHIEDLKKCIGSIALNSTYRNLEFIIIENNSEKQETFEYYRELEKRGEEGGIPLRIVRWEREFNYSAINNFGAKAARGEYLLLLNNDVELRKPDSIWEMLCYGSREEIGIVGARLCYPDDTIQHAGVIVGLGGIAGAAFVGLHEKENSYMHRMMSLQDLSAVTAACLLTRRSVFEACGGLCEDLAVAFNDIDYSMKVRRLGYRCVYDPYAVFYHYESKSRGLEDTPEKVRRFNGEIAIFADRWPGILREGDPYYNPNLTLRKANFALRDLTKEQPGEPYKLELDVEKQLRDVLSEKRRREKLSNI